MRSALLPLFALALAPPAMAAESKTKHDLDRMADRLNDPSTQVAMSSALAAMLSAVLDMRVDGLAKALEPLNNGRPVRMHGRTVRDLAERDNPDFESKMQSDTRAAVGALGGLAAAAAVMLPQLEEAARKMKDALPETH